MKALLFLLIFSLAHATSHLSLALAEAKKYAEILRSEEIRMRKLREDFTIDLDTVDKARE